MRIGSIIILHLSELWRAKFFILFDVILLVRPQEKFEIDHHWELAVANMMKWYLTIINRSGGEYPPLFADTAANNCFSIYNPQVLIAIPKQLLYFLMKLVSHDIFFLQSRQEVNTTCYNPSNISSRAWLVESWHVTNNVRSWADVISR